MSIVDKINEIFDKPKHIDYYEIFSQLNSLLRAGADLPTAVSDVAKYESKLVLKRSLMNISKSLSIGVAAGAAFAKEKTFPRLVSPTIEAGEKAGHLSKVFNKLSELMWMQDNLYGKVKNALLVPKISAVMMTLMGIGYIKLAIPEYIKLYKDSNIEVPFIVEIVTNIVNAIVDYWYITFLFLFLLWKIIDWFINNRANVVDRIKLKIPIYKELHYYFLQHQFSSILAIMLSSGLTEDKALTQVSKIVDNSVMSSAIVKVRNEILKGNGLAQAINKNNRDGLFHNMLLSSIYAGEKSNTMVVALEECSKYYERKINNLTETVSTKLTFIVMIPMSIVVVAMFAFTMIPMFNYIGQVTQ